MTILYDPMAYIKWISTKIHQIARKLTIVNTWESDYVEYLKISLFGYLSLIKQACKKRISILEVLLKV